MAVLTLRGIEKGWGTRTVLRGVDLLVEAGERVGLVGHNGCGKSTLLSIAAGREGRDAGQISVEGRLALLDQDPPLPGVTVDDAIADATRWHRDLIDAWQRANEAGDHDLAASFVDRIEVVGWEVGYEANAILDRLRAPPRSALVANLSGGERRRVALARVLLSRPEILLLDEPTNHLDADTVEWLQSWLEGFRGTVLLVTHDRYLLEAVATRIVEIDDGVAVSYPGSYADYLVSRAERRASLMLAEDRRLAMIEREAEWASRSPAARTTKQKARLDRLEVLRAARPLKRDEKFALELGNDLARGQTVIELHKVGLRYGSRALIHDLDMVLRPGDRVGILGPNGIGKSSLLRLVLGAAEPTGGRVLRSARLKIGLLDQERSGLDPNATVWDAAGDGNDSVKVGEHWIALPSFLERFLFARDSFKQRVSGLSGGERARLLLAKLMLQGANLLLLDEPTNDLDLMTLAVLEEALLDYSGAALIVTHDRAFLDRVCTRVLAFEGEGRITEYASRQQVPRRADPPAASTAARPAPAVEAPKAERKRLSYKEQQELNQLPGQLEAWESRKGELEGVLSDAAAWRPGGPALAAKSELDALEARIAAGWDRWSELDARS